MNKFYNPALYKAPQRRELTEEERIYVNSGGADSKSLTEKDGQKADLEGELQAGTEAKKNAAAELLALGEYMAQLHGSCDFLVANFDARKAARASEIDALGKAKAVLSGADYSLLQTATAFLPRRA